MKKKTYLNVAVLLLIFLIPLVYNNCAGYHDDGSANMSSLNNRCDPILVSAFESGYWSFVKTNCADCHSQGPGSGLFASNNRADSFRAFIDKTAIKIADFSVGAHKPPYTGPHLEEPLAPIRTAWAAAEAEYATCLQQTGNDDGGGNQTVPNRFTVAKPFNPNAGQNLTMTWDLGTEMATAAQALQGASFEMQIRAVDFGGGFTAYEFRRPRLLNPNGAAAAYVRGVGVRVNGSMIITGTAFYHVERYVPNIADNNTRNLAPQGGSIIYSSPLGTPIDVQIGFTDLRASDIDFQPQTYVELTAATTGVLRNACFACHGTDGGLNIQTYTNLVGRLGNSGLTLVTPFSLANSHLYQRMTAAGSPMPPTGLLPQDQRDRVRDWILDGAPNTNNDVQR